MVKKIKNKRSFRKAKKAEKNLQKALKKESKRLSKTPQETAYDVGKLTWKAPEFVKIKRGWLWYAIFVTIFIGGGISAYLLDSWSFGLALIAFGAVYLVADRPHPKNVKIILSDLGVKVGNKVYQYNRIKAFWIVYNPPFNQVLNIKVYNELLEEIEIQLGKQDPTEIYEFLSRRLPELEGKEPGFVDNLSKLLRL
jgi:hypothetical protein